MTHFSRHERMLQHSVALRNPFAECDCVKTIVGSFAKSKDLMQHDSEKPAVRGGGRRRGGGGEDSGGGGGNGIGGKFLGRHPRNQRLNRFRRSLKEF